MQIYPLDASLTLAEAGPKWLEQHKSYIKPNTLRNYRACIKLLTAFIGDTLVKDVHIGHIRAYQEDRSASHQVPGRRSKKWYSKRVRYRMPGASGAELYAGENF